MKVLVAAVVLHVEQRLGVLRPEGLPNAAVPVFRDDAIVRSADGAAPDVEDALVGPEVGEQLPVRADDWRGVLGVAKEH